MPYNSERLIAVQEETGTQVALEAGINIFTSLNLLIRAEELSGLHEWVYRTASSLSGELNWNHHVVFEGLHYAVLPEQSAQSFPEYIHHLSIADPFHLRAKLFSSCMELEDGNLGSGDCLPPDLPEMDPESVLGSFDDYLKFLEVHFNPGKINTEIERAAYKLMIDPPAMQKFIVSHMWRMWEGIMSKEWRRVEPLLQQTVQAFHQENLQDMPILDAARVVLGSDFDSNREKLTRNLENVQLLFFVPSAHIGPYQFELSHENTKWLFFNIRSPRGIGLDNPELNQTEILVRLNALTDETRLMILQLISRCGSLTSSEVIEQLGLSQSAASRHLMQLSATGYLTETRKQGAKQYTLNTSRIDETLQAVAGFLYHKS